jgi:hypothetical protein
MNSCNMGELITNEEVDGVQGEIGKCIDGLDGSIKLKVTNSHDGLEPEGKEEEIEAETETETVVQQELQLEQELEQPRKEFSSNGG